MRFWPLEKEGWKHDIMKTNKCLKTSAMKKLLGYSTIGINVIKILQEETLPVYMGNSLCNQGCYDIEDLSTKK